MRPASFVAVLYESLKFAGTVITALLTSSFRNLDASSKGLIKKKKKQTNFASNHTLYQSKVKKWVGPISYQSHKPKQKAELSENSYT